MADRAGDPIAVVEAAYTWEPDLGRWLQGIVGALAAYDVGGGVAAYTVRARGTPRTSEPCASAGARPSATRLRAATEDFPPAIARRAYAPTEHVGNVAFRLARLARESRFDLARIASTLPEAWAVVAGDPAEEALAIVFPRGMRQGSPDQPFPHRGRKQLGYVGAHLGAALRLRQLARPTTDDAATEAVLTPGGAVLHATGAAKRTTALASLTSAVLHSQRARGRMRRSEPDEAIRQWSALVQGRWTLVDATERDGKRYVLARENALRAGDPLALTPEERAVVWLATCGHTYKYMAYELGLTLGTVTSRLRRAMRKLRLTSRSELLAKVGVPRE